MPSITFSVSFYLSGMIMKHETFIRKNKTALVPFVYRAPCKDKVHFKHGPATAAEGAPLPVMHQICCQFPAKMYASKTSVLSGDRFFILVSIFMPVASGVCVGGGGADF